MKYLSLFLLFILLFLPACASVETPTTQATEEVGAGMPVPGESPTEMVVATVSPEPAPPGIPLVSYTDSPNGFRFEYPAAWMLDEVALGERAPAGYQLTSWPHDPGMVSELVEGGTIMNINLQLWDPKHDLEGFTATRIQAWEASGFAIVSREVLVLANGELAKEFVVQSPDGLGYFLFTTLGENYLVASGSGDLDLVKLVARSIR